MGTPKVPTRHLGTPPTVSQAHGQGRSTSPLLRDGAKAAERPPNLPRVQSTCAAELHTRVHVCAPRWGGQTLSHPTGPPPVLCTVLGGGGACKDTCSTPTHDTVHIGGGFYCSPQPGVPRGMEGELCPPLVALPAVPGAGARSQVM